MARDCHGLLFGRIVFIAAILAACALLSSVVPEHLCGQELARAERVASAGRAPAASSALAPRVATNAVAPLSRTKVFPPALREPRPTMIRKAPLYLSRLQDRPAAFIENRGQFDARVKFQVRIGGKILWLTDHGIVFDALRPKVETAKSATSGQPWSPALGQRPSIPAFSPRTLNPKPPQFERLVFSESFKNANVSTPEVVTCAQPGIYNYFIGNDPKKWVKDVHAYSQVIYRDVWKGIDLKLYGKGSNIEQEFVVHPGADTSQIQLAYQGIKGLDVAKDGSLVVHTAFGDLRESSPRIYQQVGGKQVQLNGRFELAGTTSYTFYVTGRNFQYALVVDPTLLYSTYLGGSYHDQATGIAVDAAGDAYVTGQTFSSDFPTTPGAFQSSDPAISTGTGVAFVTKLNPLGSQLVYSTYLGNQYGIDVEGGIALDSSGDAYITGGTGNPGFPTTQNAFQMNCSSSTFFTKLNATGDSLIYSTCLGNEFNGYADYAAIAVDSAGQAYLTGAANPGLPTTPNAFQAKAPGGLNGTNAFVAILNPAASGAGSLVYSTYLGGSNQYGSDAGRAIAVDTSGMVYVAGQTDSTDFPTSPGAFQTHSAGFPTCAGSPFPYTGPTAFLSKLNPSASGAASLIYSTYLGAGLGAAATGLAVDRTGGAYVTGYSPSCNITSSYSDILFPTTPGAFQADINTGQPKPFVTKFSAAGSGLVYSTMISASVNPADSAASDIALDSSNDAYIVGSTRCQDNGNFPVTPDAFQAASGVNAGGYCEGAFLTELNPTGTALVYSTYLGRSGFNAGAAVAVDPTGDAYVAGYTSSLDFPVTQHAFQAVKNDVGGCAYDLPCPAAFVTRFPLGTPSGLSIAGVLPEVGGNAGSVTATIVGTGFQPGATVQLDCAGSSNVVGTNTTVSADGRTMTTTFNLVGTTPEGCNVVVTNANNTTVTKSQGFTVQQGGAADIWMDLLGESKLHGGYAQQYYLVYGNRGNIDSDAELFAVAVPIDPRLNSQPSPDFLVESFQASGNDVYIYDVPSVAAGDTWTFPVTLTSAQAGHTKFAIRAQEMPLTQFISSIGSAAPPGAGSVNPNSAGNVSSAPVFDLFSLPELYDHCPEFQYYPPTQTCPGCSAEWSTYQGYLALAQSTLSAAQASRKALLLNALPVAGDIAKAVAAASAIAAISEGLGDALVAKGILTTSEAVAFKAFVGTLVQYTYDMKQAGPNNPAGVLTATGNAEASIAESATLTGKITNSRGVIKSIALADQVDRFSYVLNLVTTAIQTGLSDAKSLQITWNAWNAALGNFLNADTHMCVRAHNYVQCASSTCGGGPPPPPPPPPPCVGPGCFPIEVITPGDPNDKVGSQGVGAQQWISGATPLRYAVFFANEKTATAPAGKVVITDQLNLADENLTTFSLGPITFQNQLLSPPPGLGDFSTTVDLRPATNLLVAVSTHLDATSGLLTWTFQSLDPTTNQPPTDPSLGFLPIGGEGGVFFTVKPKQGLATSTQIQNQASIVFDVNAHINTPTWFNALDNSPPTSSVRSLPTTESCSNFQVSWSGSDVGSGVQDFTIFVSDNGGPFTSWLANTTETSASYSAQAGHSYGFYSIARDLTGNIETSKTTAEATTEVGASTICGRPTLYGRIITKVLVGNTLNLSIQLTNNGSVDARSLVISQLRMRTLGGTGTVIVTSPSFPLSVGSLAAGASTTLNLTLTLPSTVTKFSIIEDGTLQGSSDSSYNFSIGQVVYPQ